MTKISAKNAGQPGRNTHPDAASGPGRHALRVADLSPGRSVSIEIVPDSHERQALAQALDLLDLRKVRFTGTLSPLGRRDWELTGRLGATVVQPCVVTLEPVTTRIDTDLERRYLADFIEPDETETEMPEDEAAERLGTHIDPAQVMEEALALALPLYPRAEGVEQAVVTVTEPGKAAMTDADAKPFAGLAALRDKMKDADE